MAETLTLTARWVFPVSSPPLERGLVTVAGDRIAAVGPHGSRTADVDLGDVAIIPGLVNTHTHLDLTGARGLIPPTPDFTAWLRQVIAYRRQRAPEPVQADVQAGIVESVRHGTTLVGDIAADGTSWDDLADAPMRAVVYYELLGLQYYRAQSARRAAAQFNRGRQIWSTLRFGYSPHAPYSFNYNLLRGSTWLWPSAIHLAETTAELELLERHSGPFVSFLAELGVWDPTGLARSVEHVIELTKSGREPILYVHCNYLSPDAPIPPHSTVVYCPHTHAAFGHAPHPFRAFLNRGVRVALGTDSLASNPDLSVLSEARFLHDRHPDLPGAALLRMATLSGAEALGWADATGSLEAGKSADFAVVPLPPQNEPDPHILLFVSDRPVRETWFCGCRVWPAD
jgi:cytosine/adenosine deaminase-related metal-dependent hydrolase